MNNDSWLKIFLSVQSRVISGHIYLQGEERLLDVLNRVSKRSESRSEVLELSDVDIKDSQGQVEHRASVFVMKPSIDFAVTWERDGGRGVGANKDIRAYPYTPKSPVAAKVDLPTHSLNGQVHCTRGQRASNLLEENTTFIPMTNVSVEPPESGLWRDIAFVAVNRGQILCLQPEEIPLMQINHN
jgi:hypothetical protein